MRYFVFLVCAIISFTILRYRRAIKEFTGDLDFAEKIFGMGGTNTFILIFAILLFIGSLMYAMGTLDAFLQGTIGKIF